MPTKNNKPKCSNCYDKGFASYMRGAIVGGRYIIEPEKIIQIFCQCAKGKRLRARNKDKDNFYYG